MSCERLDQTTALSYRNKICRPQNCGCDSPDHRAINANMGSLYKCHVLTLSTLSAVAVIYCPVITHPYFSCFANIYEARHNFPFISHLSTILLCEVLDYSTTKIFRPIYTNQVPSICVQYGSHSVYNHTVRGIKILLKVFTGG